MPEVQALANAGNLSADTALAKITAYAVDGNSPTPTVQDYADAGVINVDGANLNAVNARVDVVGGDDADTVLEVQALANAGNLAADTALAKIRAYAVDSNNPISTVQDYANAGVINVDGANLNAVNARVDAVGGDDVDTVPEVQALANAGNLSADTALAKITAYAVDGNSPIPTVQDYADAGVINVDGVNVGAVNTRVDAVGGDDADTVPEVQGLVDGVNGIANTAQGNRA